jgi:hypothetical protein
MGMMRRNPVYQVLVDLLDQHSISHSVEFRGRHPSLRFFAGGLMQRISLRSLHQTAALHFRRPRSSVGEGIASVVR